MPTGPKGRSTPWEPSVPDESDAGTESPDVGAPPPPGSAGSGRTLPPRVTTTPFVRPQPTLPPSAGHTVPPAASPAASPAAGAPVAAVGLSTTPPAPAAPRGRSPLAWVLIAMFAGGAAFVLVFGVVAAILLASR